MRKLPNGGRERYLNVLDRLLDRRAYAHFGQPVFDRYGAHFDRDRSHGTIRVCD
jgi:hypothetical protein